MAHMTTFMPQTCSQCVFCFRDAVKEGDGDRIVLYWKLLLPVFKQQGHHNYAKEAFVFLPQTLFLSECMQDHRIKVESYSEH